MVQAMEKALGNLVGTSSGFLESLPGPVKARISYLEELQDEYNRLEEELEEQMKELEMKYKPFFGRFVCICIADGYYLKFAPLSFCVQMNYVKKERRLFVGKRIYLKILKLLEKMRNKTKKRHLEFQIFGS